MPDTKRKEPVCCHETADGERIENMEKIMAVLTGEKKYAERLCSYCNRNKKLIFTAVPFDDPAEYTEFCKKHKVELLLADSRFLKGNGSAYETSGKSELKAGKIISLEEGFSFERAVSDSAGSIRAADCINKYQPAETLLREIMTSCSDMELLVNYLFIMKCQKPYWICDIALFIAKI